MKLISAELVNYIGIFNGLGVDRIFIDFTQCKNNIVVIKGDNGAGKTTLFKALTPMPDSNSAFIPGKHAIKNIIYADGEIQYRIAYSHEVKDGNRSSKAWIYRTQRDAFGAPLEIGLNPSGNITDAREILYDIFKLDANFMALSQLSSDDRGLADKKPADRKKFINSIIDILEVYNNMYKTLSKRASLFKATINSISTKIDSLGNEENLKLTLASIESRIRILQATKDQLIGNIAICSNIIVTDDPRGDIRTKYNELSVLKSNINSALNQLEPDYSRYKNEYTNLSKCNNKIEVATELIQLMHEKYNNTNTIILLYKSENETLLIKKEDESKRLQEKVVKLESLSDTENYKNIKNELLFHKNNIIAIEKGFSNIKFSRFDNISKDELISGINTLKNIKDAIDTLKSDKEYKIIQSSIIDFLMNDKIPNIDEIEQSILSTNEDIRQFEGEYNSLLHYSLLIARSDSIPKQCILREQCDLAKDIVDAIKLDPNPRMDKINRKLNELICKSKSLSDSKEINIRITECVIEFKSIMRQLNSNMSIIMKLPFNENFIDTALFLQKILDGYKFNEINDLFNSAMEWGNMLEIYRTSIKCINTLEVKSSEYAGRDALVTEISKDIAYLSANLGAAVITIDDNNKNMELKIAELKKYAEAINICNKFIEFTHIINNKKNELTNVDNEIILISTTIETIRKCENSINLDNGQLTNVINMINPLLSDRDKLIHAIQLLEEYCEELEEYKAKYEKVETIKFYNSPTTGIQTVFMAVYMNKIIHIANQLLTLLFDGEYVLHPFIINEQEFRIPCSGRGLMNDDISSMSTSQICMISMILSFALLYHSSTKYNILKLDEIDGGLDTNNRLQFIKLLDNMMHKLECEQCIMISHNSELSMDNLDVIVLKNSDPTPIAGNIIYRH